MSTMLTGRELAEGPEDPTQARSVTLTLDVSATALRRVRAGFNPDRVTEVGQIHLLSACLITLLEGYYKDLPPRIDPKAPEHEQDAYQRTMMLVNEQNRHVSLAITRVEEASMFGVKAATTELYAAKNVRR